MIGRTVSRTELAGDRARWVTASTRNVWHGGKAATGPLSLGAQVVLLPGGPGRLHGRDDVFGEHVDVDRSVSVRVRGRWPGAPVRATCRAPPRISAASARPGAALLGLRARFVLRLAGRQCGLLRQLSPLDRRSAGGRARPGTGVPGRRVRPRCRRAGTTSAAATRRRFRRSRGPLLGVGGVGTVGEPHPDPLDEQGFQPGVVVLGGGDLVPIQRPAVQRQPPPVDWVQTLLRDGDVGVQIGVARARVAVRKGGRDHAGGVDLGDAVGAAAGVGGVLLQPADGVPHCLVVAGVDRRSEIAGAIAHSVETLLTGENVRS